MLLSGCRAVTVLLTDAVDATATGTGACWPGAAGRGLLAGGLALVAKLGGEVGGFWCVQLLKHCEGLAPRGPCVLRLASGLV